VADVLSFVRFNSCKTYSTQGRLFSVYITIARQQEILKDCKLIVRSWTTFWLIRLSKTGNGRRSQTVSRKLKPPPVPLTYYASIMLDFYTTLSKPIFMGRRAL
jgi:hypothetical protein